MSVLLLEPINILHFVQRFIVFGDEGLTILKEPSEKRHKFSRDLMEKMVKEGKSVGHVTVFNIALCAKEARSPPQLPFSHSCFI